MPLLTKTTFEKKKKYSKDLFYAKKKEGILKASHTKKKITTLF